MNIKPVGNKIAVLPLEVETQTASGIYIPESATDAPVKAKVVAVGSGSYNKHGVKEEVGVSVNDTVVFLDGHGEKVKLNDVEYVFLTEDQIIATITD